MFGELPGERASRLPRTRVVPIIFKVLHEAATTWAGRKSFLPDRIDFITRVSPGSGSR